MELCADALARGPLGDAVAQRVVEPQGLRLALDCEEVQEAIRRERDDGLQTRLHASLPPTPMGVALPHSPAIGPGGGDVGLLEVDAVAERKGVVGKRIERDQDTGFGVGNEDERQVHAGRVEADRVPGLAPLFGVHVAVPDLRPVLIAGTVPGRDPIGVEDVGDHTEPAAIGSLDTKEQRRGRRAGGEQDTPTRRLDCLLHEYMVLGSPHVVIRGRVGALAALHRHALSRVVAATRT